MTIRLLFGLAAALVCAAAHGVELIGYVPDYRMGQTSYVNNVLPAQLAMLDEVRYFGITVNADGSLTTDAAHLANIDTIKQKIDALPAAGRALFR